MSVNHARHPQHLNVEYKVGVERTIEGEVVQVEKSRVVGVLVARAGDQFQKIGTKIHEEGRRHARNCTAN